MKSLLQHLFEKSIYNPLTHNDLARRGGGRIDVFVNKIKDNEYFSTVKGAVQLIVSDIDQLRIDMDSKGYSQKFKGKTDTNKSIVINYPKDFYKTPEFGGRGAGSGTSAEDVALSALRNSLRKVMNDTGMPYVNMIVGKNQHKVIDVQTTPGTPKSDFHLINTDGEECVWISHKDGNSAKDFQQWGGVTELNKAYPNHKEIESFIDAVRTDSNGELDGVKSYRRLIKDKKLINVAVYGVGYGKAAGRQNVDILLQGPIKLTKSSKGYIMKSNHTSYNGDLPTQDYKAAFFARKADRNNFGIKNSRFMIAPVALRRKSTIDI
jgi:hypothetical protein